MLDIKSYLTKWSEKLSISVELIEEEFNKVLAEEKVMRPNATEEQQSQRSLQRLALIYKKQIKSPAVGFEGVIIGASDCVDIIAKQKREATELYKSEPQLAINNGVTNEEGVPLDTRKEWGTGKANPMFGKPLPDHNHLRNIFGIAVKSGTQDKPKFFSMVLSGKKAAAEDLPVFKPIRFMAIDKSEDNLSDYKLNASSFTTFNIDEKLVLPEYKELILEVCPDLIVSMADLDAYHTAEQKNFNRLAIIEADISSLNLEPTSVGSRVMTVEDINSSLEDLDAKGLTCWIPPRVEIDFAEGSKVLVVGRTGQGKKRDEQGNQTEELGDITINVMGLYAIPEFKVELPKEMQPVTETSLDIN